MKHVFLGHFSSRLGPDDIVYLLLRLLLTELMINSKALSTFESQRRVLRQRNIPMLSVKKEAYLTLMKSRFNTSEPVLKTKL